MNMLNRTTQGPLSLMDNMNMVMTECNVFFDEYDSTVKALASIKDELHVNWTCVVIEIAF